MTMPFKCSSLSASLPSPVAPLGSRRAVTILRGAVVAASASLLALACSDGAPSPSGAVQEDALVGGRRATPFDPTRDFDPNPLEWVSAPREVVEANVAAQFDNPKYLADDHPLVRRVQAWADALDVRLRARHANRFRTLGGVSPIPRPRIRLMVKETPNGFSSSANTCYRVNVRFRGAPPEATPAQPNEVVLVSAKGAVGVYDRSRITCVDRMATEVAARDVVRYLEESTRVSGCTVVAEGNDVVFGEGCKVSNTAVAADERRNGASGIVLDSTTPWVTLTTGMVELYEQEEHLVFTIAHELAHFYLSHGALVKSKYNYFYRLSDENLLAQRPAPEPALEDLGKKLLALPKFRTQPIANQRYHSELFPYLRLAQLRLVGPACGDAGSPCHDACSGFSKMADLAADRTVFGTFPQATLEGAALERYWDYERETDRCLSQVRVTEGEDAAAGAVGRNLLKQVYWMAEVPPDLGAGYHVLDAVRSMNDQMFAKEAAKNALLQAALDERVGYYTTEQEADSIALQWMADLGVSPDHAVEHWFRFSKFYVGREQESPFNFEYKRCRALYDASPRWSENGQSVPVPIGSFGDTHHSRCYRIFAIDRELSAHDYVVAPAAVAPDPQLYARLHDEIVELHDREFPGRVTLENLSAENIELLTAAWTSEHLHLETAAAPGEAVFGTPPVMRR